MPLPIKHFRTFGFSIAVVVAFGSSLFAQERSIDFVKDVRPILSDKCFHCHGPDANTRETDLRFDSEESAKSDLGGYQAIVDGDPDESELIERIMSDDEYSIMPPEDSHLSLTDLEKETLRLWIKQGAKWSAHWAYLPPEKYPDPESNSEWPKNFIDNFILARLQRDGLSPAIDADDVTLVRRLCFDLTGLPPTPDQVNNFVQGKTNLDDLVDELLASEHYGERMAVYWLDLVRFADTVGYHGDQDHSISPYRDWVIDALNENMRFNQFTREQLAGDLIKDSSVDQKIASGYNRLLQTSHEGGVQPKEYIAIYSADRVRNVSEVWMGATVGCAQCHDHKYDPYTSKDFYSMAAFFADIDDEEHILKGTNSLPTARAPEIEVLSKRNREALAALRVHKAKLEADGCDPDSDQLKEVEEKIAQLEKLKLKTMITVPLGNPRVTRILPRGNWMDEGGEIVGPSVPEFMAQIESKNRPTRLDFADWLINSENGSGLLTARVFVNRIWALFFGVGLCPSLDDLGGQGQPPNHPELLDRLSIEFVESGWDIKHLIKLIVSSHAYRMSSVASTELRQLDPNNHLFARQSSFRLPAEFIRDNALAVSGLLNRDIGGPSVKPYQPKRYYQHLNFPKREYESDSDNRQWRRGLYVHWQRQFLHPMLYAFDAPRREECTAKRSRSNTPSAALVLLNDPTFVEAARALANQILAESDFDDRQRIEFAFQQVLSRQPVEFEIETVLKLLNMNRQSFNDNPESAKALVEIGISKNTDGVNEVELASWTMVARTLLNLGEAVTRN